MSNFQSKNWTAKELIESGYHEFNIVVFGFDFHIITDSGYAKNPVMYIDSRRDNSNLAPNACKPVFTKLSRVISAIEKDLNRLHKQISDFKKDYKKATVKHFNYLQKAEFIFNEDKDKQRSEIIAHVKAHPSDIIKFDPFNFEKEPDIVKISLYRFYHNENILIDVDYFAAFDKELIRKTVSEILGFNEFQEKAMFNNNMESIDCLNLLLNDIRDKQAAIAV